jgi:hypothetical protein
MKFSLNRLRRSRAAHTLSVVAILSLVALLHPYCEPADTAKADAGLESDGHHGTDPGDWQSSGADICPSLDHTPAVLPDVVSLASVGAAAKIPLARLMQLGGKAASGFWSIVPRATPPPTAPLPLYLRYAHLLI